MRRGYRQSRFEDELPTSSRCRSELGFVLRMVNQTRFVPGRIGSISKESNKPRRTEPECGILAIDSPGDRLFKRPSV